ncbi:hypothetical protein NIE88_19020 [Sporolactobacillus shoreicorticis]|uniref:Novel toxin 21 domain-containing protein n=1 Tax=Sporolactobacillus shoreicorticis TaxID=1923877 RepID=A0ABW5S5I3_9BACL|nr:hypothetical protein [Sporolactobacillus shoreicorticis]MCO7127843.1 hypothetical protein [Sporolactobacillus shoreicorticis]
MKLRKSVVKLLLVLVLIFPVSFSTISFVQPKEAKAIVLPIGFHQSVVCSTYGIPSDLVDFWTGKVKMKRFTDKVKGKTAYRDPKTKWYIDKDKDGHKGSKWKLKNKNGKRKASLKNDGTVVGK